MKNNGRIHKINIVNRLVLAAAGVLFLLAASNTAGAVRAGRWEFSDRAAFAKFKISGFEVTQEGRIKDGLVSSSIPVPADYVWSIVETADRVYMGVGDGAKILYARKNAEGGVESGVEVAWEGDGLEVYTLALLPDGKLAAGVSPVGTLLILEPTETALQVVWSETISDSYIWRVLPVEDDLWLVTGSGRTGVGGGIFRRRNFSSSGGEMELIYRADDPHILSMARSGNRIYAGTQGQQGVLLAVDALTARSPRVSIAYDPPQNEIVDVALSPDGYVYFMGLAQSGRRPARTEIAPSEGEEEEGEEAPPERPQARPQPEGGNTIFRIDASGHVEEWVRARTAIRAMNFNRHGLLVANSDMGQVFRIDGPLQSSLMLALDEKLLLSLTDRFVGTGKPAMLHEYRRVERGGFLRSDALDAKTQGDWGVVTFESKGPWEVRTRSGNAETPNNTWSAWSLPIKEPGMRIESPLARYLQFEVRHSGESDNDYMRELSITYQVTNRAPRVSSVSVKPVSFEQRNLSRLSRSGPLGQVVNSFAQAAKNASQQAARGFTEFTMEELLQPFAGLVHVTWMAEDPDLDKLAARIEVIDEATSRRLLIEEEFEGDGYLLNTNNFPDGRYSAVVTVTDEKDNDAGNERTATQTSDIFTVDNTPPVVKVEVKDFLSDGKVELAGSATDATGRIESIWYYDEDGVWQRLSPDDGIADQSEEIFHVVRPTSPASSDGATARAIIFKAIDQNGNVGYARLSF